jgi:predicted 3-demethylubiquinone-9 3-methyltransferase (glyoxalase superfamily)
MATVRQKIVPYLWFDKEAVEAVEFYTSLFPDSRVTHTATLYDTPSGTAVSVTFELCGQEFMAISAGPHFTFNEAVSFVVLCEDQAEVDYYWDALTGNGGEESMCGWLKDKYGLSWQIVPVAMDEMMSAQDPAALARVTQAMLQMRKLDIAALERARAGE